MKATINTTFSVPSHCPDCKEKGYKVSVKTLFSHITDISKVDENKMYWLCKNPVCDTVYFGGSTFRTHDINQEFGLKESSSVGAKLCYCFNHTKKSVSNESIHDIENMMSQFGCQCDVRNITGECCLSDIKKHLKQK